jgi:hypothetical protein
MKFFVTKTSTWNYKKHIEINSLEELMDFVKDNGGEVVLSEPYPCSDNLPSIEIYDDYRE